MYSVADLEYFVWGVKYL